MVIERVCAATRYSTSCEKAFLGDKRYRTATAEGLVAGMAAMATLRSRKAQADVHTLATSVAPTANNMNLTTLAAGCTESLDLAKYYVQRSHFAFTAGTRPPVTTLEDVEAWLSGALTLSYDCYYSLTKFQATASASTRSSAMAFVAKMGNRMNVTVELISNALALTGATLEFGPNATWWRRPPESRVEQLQRLTISSKKKFPSWLGNANRAIAFDGAASRAKLVANVTVALGSKSPSIQAAVDKAPSWSQKR